MTTTEVPFLQCLYNQPAPVGTHAHGVHYSVYRAAVWQSPNLHPIATSAWHDVAVIWDDDHDTRVLLVLEAIYHAGLLPALIAIGERKGGLTVLVRAAASPDLLRDGGETLRRNLAPLADVEGDVWPVEVEVTDAQGGGIVSPYQDSLYLQAIDRLWRLGSKARPPALAPAVMCS